MSWSVNRMFGVVCVSTAIPNRGPGTLTTENAPTSISVSGRPSWTISKIGDVIEDPAPSTASNLHTRCEGHANGFPRSITPASRFGVAILGLTPQEHPDPPLRGVHG